MSKRDDSISLNDMLSHASEAIQLLGSASVHDLKSNRVLQLALTRLVEIVGEAAIRVSNETKENHQMVPWAEMSGMRHRLAHGYDVIDLDILWNTIAFDLPDLVSKLKQIIER